MTAMDSRERFEAWIKTVPELAQWLEPGSDPTTMYPNSWRAWQARDAEVQQLLDVT